MWARAVAEGVITREQVTELVQVLIGEADGRRNAGEITPFDSSGLAIQDLGIAKLAYAKADTRHRGFPSRLVAPKSRSSQSDADSVRRVEGRSW